MHRFLSKLFIASLLTGFAVTSGARDIERRPAGFWISEKKDTVVRIEPCGDNLCGYITWVHPEEEQLTPVGEPLCEQKVLWGFEQSSSEQHLWKNGNIYRADKDKEYSGRIRVTDSDEIKVRGYIGLPFLGKTYTLTRVRESQYPSCSVTDSSLTELTDD